MQVLDVGSGIVSHLELRVKAPVTLEIIPYDMSFGDDMEQIQYPDNTFDIVHCRNALDHTKNAETALNEMIRVCKPKGAVFIKCWLDQAETKGHHHWSAKEDGTFEGAQSFSLKDYGFTIETIKNGGERRYDYIEATLEKPWSA